MNIGTNTVAPLATVESRIAEAADRYEPPPAPELAELKAEAASAAAALAEVQARMPAHQTPGPNRAPAALNEELSGRLADAELAAGRLADAERAIPFAHMTDQEMDLQVEDLAIEVEERSAALNDYGPAKRARALRELEAVKRARIEAEIVAKGRRLRAALQAEVTRRVHRKAAARVATEERTLREQIVAEGASIRKRAHPDDVRVNIAQLTRRLDEPGRVDRILAEEWAAQHANEEAGARRILRDRVR